MNEAVLKDTTNPLVLVEEFRDRKDGEQHEGMVGRFHSEVHDDVSKADKQWVRNPVASHSGDVSLI